MGTNSGGLNTKKESLFSLVNQFSPSIITIQETKFNFYGTIKIPGYEIFENLRKEKQGGGLLTAVDLDLNPVLITSNEDVDLLVIQFEIENNKIRSINGYGPQEDDEDFKINLFWQSIETEIICAKEENCLVIIQLDANAKVGNGVIENDPHPISKNGKIMLEMVKRQGFVIANGTTKCRGKITRERVMNEKTERSIIDYYILCERMAGFLEDMHIDDEREFVLKHNVKKRKTT